MICKNRACGNEALLHCDYCSGKCRRGEEKYLAMELGRLLGRGLGMP
jgi:hypothetical protein